MGNVSVEHNAPLLQSYNKRHQHCTWGDISYIVKKTTLILPKSSLKLISLKCSSFLLTTYLLCLVDVFFKREPACLLIQTVLLFFPTCSLIRTRKTSYQGFSRKTKKKPARTFNFRFHYIDDVLSLNNSRFGDFVDHIYPIELVIKDTTDPDMSTSYLDLHLQIDSDGRLRTHFTTKEMISIFPIWTFHVYLATFQHHLHMEYISLSW